MGDRRLTADDMPDWSTGKMIPPNVDGPRRPAAVSAAKGPESAVSAKIGALTADVLAEMEFEPLRYAVPEILPAGLALLAGKPKFGKSFLAMQVSIAVASGGYALGAVRCQAGDVLYLALEDGPRRLRDRLHQILPLGGFPARLHLATEAPRIGDGLEQRIERWLAEQPDPRLVVIDVLRCVKPEARGKGSAYDDDANTMAPLHELSKRWPNVCFLVLHHVRKLEAEDAFDTISGTLGLTGVADTLIVTVGHADGAKLVGKGRDIEGFEKALKRRAGGGWEMTGDARELSKTAERQRLLDVLKEAEGETLRTSQIAKAAATTESNASHLLKRLEMEGLVGKAGFGKWTSRPPCQSVQGVQSAALPTPDIEHIEHIERANLEADEAWLAEQRAYEASRYGDEEAAND